MLQEPEVVGNWFRERVLGSGAFGVVTLWKNSSADEKIAIKKFRNDLGPNLSSKQKERWTKEVEMMQKINHVNIVSFRKLPDELSKELSRYNLSKLPMLSMEYCEGGDLRSVLSKAENCCGLMEKDVRNALGDLSNAVSYLHSLGITHRDLKPENVVLHSADRLVCKLIDLGYAKEIDAASVSASLVGTIQYLAPEFFYSKTYSCSVDYWSLGLVSFELCCGSRPFLTNMSPAQWIRYVQDKKRETICIWQDEDKNIKFSEEIWAETHISSWLRESLSKWLQSALEFNPKLRGRESLDSGASIFTRLNQILEQKIVSVFCVPLLKFLYYEIDNYTLIDTLVGWIERDTKINKTEQVLFNADSTKIINDQLAIQFFDKSYTADPMIYVFKKNDILKTDINPEMPSLVRSMLENMSTMPYYFQKRCYAHSLYFIYKENRLYNTILDACQIKLGYLETLFNEIRIKYNSMLKHVDNLINQKEFCRSCLNYDVESYLKRFSQDANHWKESFVKITEEIDKLNEIQQKLGVRFESINRRVAGVKVEAENKYSKFSKHSLDQTLNDALELYRNLKRRPQEKRSKPESCNNMVKILYTMLKERSNLYKDKNFTLYQQKIVDLQLEIEKMSQPLKTILDHAEKIKAELLNDNLKRQTSIWELTIKPKNIYQTIKTKLTSLNNDEASLTEVFHDVEPNPPEIFEQPSIIKSQPKPNFSIGSDKVDYGEPISLKSPVHFILGPVSKSPPASVAGATQTSPVVEVPPLADMRQEGAKANIKNGRSVPMFLIGAPTSSLISDNQNLRFELQEKTNESFLRCKSILNENLDFSFLKD